VDELQDTLCTQTLTLDEWGLIWNQCYDMAMNAARLGERAKFVTLMSKIHPILHQFHQVREYDDIGIFEQARYA